MNDQNLKSNDERTPSERRELAVKAGKASGAARRKKRELKEVLKILLAEEIKNKHGEKKTRREVVGLALIDQAVRGNVKAIKLVAELADEVPDKKLDVQVSGSQKKGNQPVVIQFVDAGDDGCGPDK